MISSDERQMLEIWSQGESIVKANNDVKNALVVLLLRCFCVGEEGSLWKLEKPAKICTINDF